jgi:hypothetical protein
VPRLQNNFPLSLTTLSVSVTRDPIHARLIFVTNQYTSAARFCSQVAACVPDVFRNFYLVKNHKIANNSATTEARKKISKGLESLEL